MTNLRQIWTHEKSRLAATLAVALLAAGVLIWVLPAQAQSAPGSVDSVTVTRADGTITASWNAPNGATKYHITYSSDGGGSWHAPVDNHTNWTSDSITFSADNSKSYIVGVRAGNDQGWSGWVNSSSAGPYTPTPPGSVASVTVTREDGALTASWDAVNNATHYHITYTVNGSGNWLLAALNHTENSIDISGVDNTETYVVGVRAGNNDGWSGWVNSPATAPFVPPTPVPTPTPTPEPTPTPIPVPARPTGLTATAGDQSVTLTWDDPANATISSYEYQVNHNDTSTGNLSGWGEWRSITSSDADTTSYTINGLTNGKEYRLKLRAANTSGGGKPAPGAPPWYVAATPEPPPPPAAPSNVAVNPNENSLDITWDAVSEATGYDVRAKAEGASDWHDVASNVSGTSYTYTTSNTIDYVAVRARNAGGVSAWTDVSRMPADDLLNVATGISSGGASAQSVQAQSQLAAPTWGTITRDLRRGMKGGNGFIYINWTGSSGATGYNVVCSTGGWYWDKCGWDNSGTVTYTSVPSGQSQPVKVSHFRREVYNKGDYTLRNSRSYMMSIRAVNADPAQASAWATTPFLHPVFSRLDDFTATRTDGQVTLSWTPNFWTTDYDVYCDNYTPGANPSYTLCATLTNQDDTAASHSVTITKSGGTHNWSAFDDAGILDIAIDSKNTWSKARWLPPLIYPNVELSVSNVGVTTATLTISGHSGAWYYKANAGPDNTCQGPVNAGTSTKDLTGLSANTAYDYAAYSDSTCTSANELATAARFTTLSSVSNLGSTKQITGTGNIDGTQKQAVAFTTGTANTGGYVLENVTIPLRDRGDRDDSMTLTLRAMEGTGDYSSSSQPSSTILATLSGTPPTDNNVWTDTTWTCSGSGCDLDPGKTYFLVAARTGAGHYQWAYALTESETALPSNNGWNVRFGHYQNLQGTWASFSDFNIAEIVFAHAPSLTASGVTATGATLTIANHNGDWYYKADAAPDNTCQGPVSGTSTTLTGLTSGTSYTYTAYSDSTCTTANELATASAFTTTLGAPTNLSWSNDFQAGGTRLSWNKPSGVTGSVTYEIQCEADRQGTTWTSCGTVTTTSSASSVSHVISGFSNLKFRVRTKVGNATSAWVEVST